MLHKEVLDEQCCSYDDASCECAVLKSGAVPMLHGSWRVPCGEEINIEVKNKQRASVGRNFSRENFTRNLDWWNKNRWWQRIAI